MKRSKRAVKPATKKASTRLSRSTLEHMLADLCQRLDDQCWIADALEKAASPTGETLSAAWPMLKVIELAAAAHASKLRVARDFARLINRP